MKTIEELLKSTGREIIAKNSVEYLQKRGEMIGPVVGKCHAEAVAQLGRDAGADALARRTALLVLKHIGHIPAKPGDVAQPEPSAEPEQPGHFTQPGGNE